MPYHLGLPIWAHPKWQGVYFDDTTSTLASYATVFNAVEGNTSFYGVPPPDKVTAWRRALEGTAFRMSFKLPRSVTHERVPDRRDLDEFLRSIRPLEAHLGPLLVQFSERSGPAELEALEWLFVRLAEAHRCVIEVRHPRFFTEPDRLSPLLERHGFGRVMLDARAVYRGDRSHPDIVNATHRKPDVPVLDTVHGGLAFVRMILHPDVSANGPWLDDRVERTATMIARGDDTTIMIHCPNNYHCTALARDFHERLRRRLGDTLLPPLSPWPVPQQASLF